MERYFLAQPSLESRSSPVHLIKLNFSLKFISQKYSWRKSYRNMIDSEILVIVEILYKEKAKAVGCCMDLRSVQVEMLIEGFRGVGPCEP